MISSLTGMSTLPEKSRHPKMTNGTRLAKKKRWNKKISNWFREKYMRYISLSKIKTKTTKPRNNPHPKSNRENLLLKDQCQQSQKSNPKKPESGQSVQLMVSKESNLRTLGTRYWHFKTVPRCQDQTSSSTRRLSIKFDDDVICLFE